VKIARSCLVAPLVAGVLGLALPLSVAAAPLPGAPVGLVQHPDLKGNGASTGAAAQLAHAATVVLDAGAVDIDAQIQMRVDEDNLVQLTEYRLHVERPGVVDLNRTPLTLPLLVPAVDGQPLDDGTLPARSAAVQTQVKGSVKLRQQHGGLQVVGTLSMGHAATVRVSYPIAIDRDRVTLGMRGAGERTWFTLAAAMTPPVRVQLALDRGSRTSRFEEGRDRLVGASLAQSLLPGEVALVRMTDLPVQPRWAHRVLVSLACLLALGAFAVGWFKRGEERARRGEDGPSDDSDRKGEA